MSSQEPKKLIEHEIVPKHILLTEEEKKELLEKYNIQPEWLPLIKIDDPVMIAINAKKGDIVKIMRKSETAGEYAVFYRYIPRD
ncbi:MAG: DNA-directed RNA polymerase subunit H [Candidatus Atabeyarchaeum deiterrae]